MKIIENEDARRYACQAVLYDFSKREHDLTRNTKLDFVNPVPVYSENRPSEPVGYADVFLEDDKVIAHIFMDYATPERLDIEASMGYKVTAVPAGDYSLVHDYLPFVDAIWIPHIGLGRKTPDTEGIGGEVKPLNLQT